MGRPLRPARSLPPTPQYTPYHTTPTSRPQAAKPKAAGEKKKAAAKPKVRRVTGGYACTGLWGGECGARPGRTRRRESCRVAAASASLGRGPRRRACALAAPAAPVRSMCSLGSENCLKPTLLPSPPSAGCQEGYRGEEEGRSQGQEEPHQEEGGAQGTHLHQTLYREGGWELAWRARALSIDNRAGRAGGGTDGLEVLDCAPQNGVGCVGPTHSPAL